MKQGRWRFAVAAVVTTVALAGCGSGGNDGESKPPGATPAASATGEGSGKDELTVAIAAQEFESLDPQMQASPPTDSVTRQIYETLVTLKDGEIEPLLATAWRNPSPEEWEFDIREGVTFHDGATLDAAAVETSFRRMLDPKNERTRSSEYGNVDSVEAVDEDTVRFKLKEVWPSFLHALAYTSGVIVSPKAIETYGDKVDQHPAGTGPYQFDKTGSGGAVELTAYDGYWGEPAQVKRLRLTPVVADNTRLLMLKSGQADIITGLPASSVGEVEQDGKLQLVATDGGLVMHIGLNTTYKPLSDVRVRQALNHAVDQQALVDSLLAGRAEVADSYLASTTVGHRASAGYEYDPAKAKELLAQAGYGSGFPLKIAVPTGRYAMAKETAEAVQGYLEAVGVKATLETMDFGAEIDAITRPKDENRVQAYLLGWQAATGEPALVSRIVFHSKQWPPDGWNTMFYASDEADRLIDEAAVEADDAKRDDLYGQLQELVVKDAPWLFLYTPQNLFAVGGGVAGVASTPDGTLLLGDVR